MSMLSIVLLLVAIFFSILYYGVRKELNKDKDQDK